MTQEVHLCQDRQTDKHSWSRGKEAHASWPAMAPSSLSGYSACIKIDELTAPVSLTDERKPINNLPQSKLEE